MKDKVKKKIIKIISNIKDEITAIKKNIKLIRKKSKKNSVFLLFDMIISYFKYGVNYEEYRLFGFYNMKRELKSTYMSKKIHNKLGKYLYDKKHFDLLNNREKFHNRFKEYLNHEFYNIKEVSFKRFEEFVLKKREVIVRSNNLGDEKNTTILNVKDFKSPAFLLDKARKSGLIIAEAKIKQNKVFNGINPNSMNTVNIVSLVSDERVNIISSYVKFGVNDKYKYDVDSVKHMTGLIDEKSGQVKGKFLLDDEFVSEHPISKVKLSGLEIPFYREMRETVKVLASELDESKEIEWVFVISDKRIYLTDALVWNDYVTVQALSKNKEGLLPYYIKNIKRKI